MAITSNSFFELNASQIPKTSDDIMVDIPNATKSIPESKTGVILPPIFALNQTPEKRNSRKLSCHRQ